MARGPIAQECLSVDGDGLVVLELKRAFSDGTTQVLFEPQDGQSIDLYEGRCCA
jgi:hypothetical protein